MKSLFRLLLVTLVAATAASASANPVSVTASQSIRIAVINTPGSWKKMEKLQTAFSPQFERALVSLYGAAVSVTFVKVSPEAAATGLQQGVYDASLAFGPKLPSAVRKSGFHAVRGLPADDDESFAAYLVLRREDSEFDALLANAFSVALGHESVRDAVPRRSTVVAALD